MDSDSELSISHSAQIPVHGSATSVSILVPAFNAAGSIESCLQSLKEQTLAPLEIIVVNDCSTDETPVLAAAVDGVTVVQNDERGGAGAARALGAKNAKGDILAFIDSDCVAPPDWVERIVAEFDRDPDLGAVGGMYRHGHARSLISYFGKFEEEYAHHVFALTPEESALSGGNKAVRNTVWKNARSGRELIHFTRVASSEDTVVSNDIRAVAKTRFILDIFVWHMPKDGFWRFIQRNITRARTRNISRMNGLCDSSDKVFLCFGGWPLFLGAVALWASFLALLSIAIMPTSWPWLFGGALALVGLHAPLSREFFRFVHSNGERPANVTVGPLQDLGLRLLICVRAAAWVIGTLIGIYQFLGNKARHYTNVVLSVLHFWWPGRISKLFYFVTAKCNARCDFCFNLDNVINWKDRKPHELTLAEIEKIAKGFGRLPYITFSGGEPFTRVDLPNVIQVFRREARTQWVSIPTNGALTKRTIDAVMEILVTCPDLYLTIQFSIDALHEDHDKSRKIKGGFEAMIKTAKRLAYLRRFYKNLRIQINTPYDTFNLDTVETIRTFCKENLEFDQQFFYMFRDDGVLVSDKNAHLADGFLDFVQRHDAEEWKKRGGALWARAVRALQNVTYADTREIKKNHAYIRPCFATQKFVTLYDDGTFTPCEVLADTELGNIRDYGFDFYEMKRRIDLNKFHKNQIIDTKCTCEWMCAPPINMLYDKYTWFRVLRNFINPAGSG